MVILIANAVLVSADIFDTEMSENEGNSSKENHDVSGSKSPKKV